MSPDETIQSALQLTQQGRLDEAEALCRQVLAGNSEQPDAIHVLAMVHHQRGELSEAALAYERVTQLQPDSALAHVALGLILLTQGNYQRGWREFEWRWQIKEMAQRHAALGKPMWRGEELVGKRILLHGERGFGDTIHFSRYLPLVAQRGGRIIFACQPQLHGLLRNRKEIEQWAHPPRPLPEFDVHCSLVSLPAVFDTTLESSATPSRAIPADVPYLWADPALAARWRSRMISDNRLKIGLAWAGQVNPLNRHLAPSDLMPLANLSGVRFYNMSKRDTGAAMQAPSELEIVDWTNEFSDFSDTAALIENLDLVISVDTSVAHLAGAMGKPVWLILKTAPDWRWMLERPDSPWYPTMRLFRQKQRGDWSAPIAEIVEALKTISFSNIANRLI